MEKQSADLTDESALKSVLGHMKNPVVYSGKACDTPKERSTGVKFSRAVHTRTVSGTEAFTSLIDDRFNPKNSFEKIAEFNVGDEIDVSDSSEDHDNSESDDIASGSSSAGSVIENTDSSGSESPSFVSDRGAAESMRQQRLKSLEMLKSMATNSTIRAGASSATGGLRARRLQMVNALASRRRAKASHSRSETTRLPEPQLFPVQLFTNESLGEVVGNDEKKPGCVSFNDYRDKLGDITRARMSRISSVRGLVQNQNLSALQLVYERDDGTFVSGCLMGKSSDVDEMVSYELSALERIIGIVSSTDPTSGRPSYICFETSFDRTLSFGQTCHDPRRYVCATPEHPTNTGVTVAGHVYHGGLVSIAGSYEPGEGIASLRPVFGEWTHATLRLMHLHQQRHLLAPSRDFDAFAMTLVKIRCAIGFKLLNDKQWSDSALRTRCRACEVEFGWKVWPRNCECCGEVFCASCAPHLQKISVFLPCFARDRSDQHRLCNTCAHQNERVASLLAKVKLP